MKTNGLLLTFLLGLSTPTAVLAQEFECESSLFLRGLTFSTGMGHYSVHDDFLRGERYSGTRPFAKVSWSRFKDGRGGTMSLGFEPGGDVRNHTLSTAGSGVTLDVEAFDRIGEFTVFGKKTTAYLGPSAGAAIFSDKPNPANLGPEPTVSFSAFFSAGVVSGVVVPLTSRLSAHGTGRFDLFSVGFRIIERMDDDLFPENVHRAAAGTFGTAGLSLHYDVDDSLSIGLGYDAQIMRIDPWDYRGVANSRLVASFTLRRWKGGES